MQDEITPNNDWNPPLKLEGVPLLSWPENVFPESMEIFVRELSRSTETPIELSAMLVLSVVATAAQKKYQVQIKSDYFEPVNLWTMPILPPASRKSRVYSEATLPLKEWEHEQIALMEASIQSANSRRKTMEARLKELRIKASKADEQTYALFQLEIEKMEKELPAIPTSPQIWTGDVTPEHLGNIMTLNDEAMAVLSDEGGIFDILSGLYSDGKANIDLFLQSHAGSSVRVDRGSRPPVFMQRPVLTMGLTVQPQVIKSICNNKTFRGRGLLGRFLYVMPNSNIGLRSLDEPSMSREQPLRYKAIIRAILDHPIPKEGDRNGLHVLKITPEAFSKWKEYAKVIESMMGEEIGHLTHITDWAGKLPGAIARIAALIHIMRYALQCPWQHEISIEDMSAAVKIGHVLINHALVVFDLLHEDNGMQIARVILKWLEQEELTHLTQRQCLRKFRRFKLAELRPGLEILKEHEILREAEVKQGPGRQAGTFIVNPLIFKNT